jgi:hypothetical protein
MPDEPSVFISFGKSGTSWTGILLILLVWVDDLFLFYPKQCRAMANVLWVALQKKFDLPDREPIDVAVGIKIIRDRANKTIYMCQERAITKTLQDTGMSLSNPSPIPGTPGFAYTREDSPSPPTPKTQQAELYRRTVCSLLHVAVWTRPDITTAVSKLARFLQNPGLKHWQQLKILLRYLNGSRMKSLTFNFSKDPSTAPGPVPAGENSPLVTFFDSSYADCPDTRRSTMGSITFLWGAVIDWRSKLYRRVTTASNKA